MGPSVAGSRASSNSIIEGRLCDQTLVLIRAPNGGNCSLIKRNFGRCLWRTKQLMTLFSSKDSLQVDQREKSPSNQLPQRPRRPSCTSWPPVELSKFPFFLSPPAAFANDTNSSPRLTPFARPASPHSAASSSSPSSRARTRALPSPPFSPLTRARARPSREGCRRRGNTFSKGQNDFATSCDN